MKPRHTLAVALLAGLAIGGLMVFQQEEPQAADHTDSPAVQADSTLDIGDFYAWHKGTGANQTLVTVLTFDGLKAPGTAATYNPDALYTIHIDNSGDTTSEHKIYVRFGKNRNDEWGVQVINLPGAPGPIAGAVDTVIDGGNNTKVYAGMRDDPFFFDLQGFQDTLSTGTLAFDKTRDSFKGTNTNTIVLEMPMSAAQGAGTALRVWATTGKK